MALTYLVLLTYMYINISYLNVYVNHLHDIYKYEE